ncbi:hypothetical protein UFOVP1590_8 [uncultured Caudovirales phage]|uniref:Uncharacterized protein n=1 Tax=uncultured Caudovirales phage TaxID=2100421 RepID=A0A6J5SNR0_9CAUD|nr:hypothetical protein UFOVP1590_8 [uncultured Caudovirales phage]
MPDGGLISGPLLGTIASGVGIASGVNSLMNSGGGSGGSGAQQAQQQATTPWWQGGGGQDASMQLQQLMKGPSSILDDPTFKAFDQYSMEASQRKLAAGGLHASGAEQSALKQGSMANANSFYQQQAGLLGSLAGVGFNPSSGVQAGLQARQQGFQQGQQGMTNIAGGLGQLRSIYGGSTGSSPNYGGYTDGGGVPQQYGEGMGPV